jgi:chemotaxis protein MotB
MDTEHPIVIIKKKAGHGGHHGGAWKVAYADFVTAMMALFIVLWLMSSTSKQTQEEIAGYFRDPKGTAAKKGSEGKPVPKEAKEKKDDMEALKKDLLRAIAAMNGLNQIKRQIEISVTEEGLRIEMVENEKGTFFELGSAKPTPALEAVLKVLAEQLKELPNKISIEGHTDAQPYVNRTNYGNWELSADRANEARREMQEDGIRLDQVSQVRGFADQRLHLPTKPFDAGNRRVSLVVQNLEKPEEAKGPMKEPIAETQPETSPSTGRAASTAAMTVAPETSKPAIGLLARAKGLFH